MPTDQTPRDADETLALPVTDPEPTTETSTDDTIVVAADDSTTVLPLKENEPLEENEPPADDTAVLALEPVEPAADETAVLVPDETRALPVTDEASPYPSTSAWSSQDQPEPYTSPIGALYAPTDRPIDRVEPDTVAEPAPVVEPLPADPPRRRLRVGTVVWGLVIAAIGVGLLAWAAGFAIDLQLAMIILLAVAGTALLVGSIVSGARAARR
ncbi:hypothetical protein ASD16_02210 [Cellulomonas sp. Root485]|uniref:hypothetical protein n=1 Tax=Cellulomonas sp. Root485 TaxID=1736546 RepID=UPI0006F1F3D1|nr:hypothetical protein [Cellulomonas sp. Root485]KQY24380.1 hypothetical protein ASD16_02210 [Cellulomonas sp. Root485]